MQRYQQIDLIKGVAVVLMILWHFSFDWVKIAGQTDVFGYWYWRIGPEIISGLFLFSSGLGTYNRFLKLNPDQNKLFPAPFRFGVYPGRKIFLWGLFLTFVTYMFFPGFIIFFGILHLIGFCILISPIFLGLKPNYLTLLGGLFLLSGYFMESTEAFASFKFWLQVNFLKRSMLDFYLPLPSMGYFLLGMGLAPKLLQKFKKSEKFKTPKGLSFLGKNSLWIYLVHQPIILALLWLAGFQFGRL